VTGAGSAATWTVTVSVAVGVSDGEVLGNSEAEPVDAPDDAEDEESEGNAGVEVVGSEPPGEVKGDGSVDGSAGGDEGLASGVGVGSSASEYDENEPSDGDESAERARGAVPAPQAE